MARKKKEPEQAVQQLDLTELINYVNYLGQQIEEIGQVTQPPNIKFGMEQIDTEGQLKGIKYFHTSVIAEMCGDISENLRDFYAKKYGSIPQITPPDFYVF